MRLEFRHEPRNAIQRRNLTDTRPAHLLDVVMTAEAAVAEARRRTECFVATETLPVLRRLMRCEPPNVTWVADGAFSERHNASARR